MQENQGLSENQIDKPEFVERIVNDKGKTYLRLLRANVEVVISKKVRNLLLRICVRHYVMSYGIICTHLFMRSRMEQN